MKSRFLPFACSLLLAACGAQQSAVDPLPSQEVLTLAAQAAQKLDSSQYLMTVNADIDSGNTWQAKALVRMDGTLQSAGEQVRAMTDITAEVADSQLGDYSLNGTVEVVVMDKDQVFMNIHSLSSQPNSAFFPAGVIAKLAGTWWLLPSEDRPPATTTMTPDPRLLQAQAQVVTVTKDNGVVPFAGSDAYHYNVTLNKEKLKAYLLSLAQERGEVIPAGELESALENVEANGELWIDARTYYMHKLTWEIRSMEYAAEGSADLDISVTFRNQNAAPTIQPPTGAKLFTPAALFVLPGSNSIDLQQFDASQDYNEDALDEILRNFNSFE